MYYIFLKTNFLLDSLSSHALPPKKSYVKSNRTDLLIVQRILIINTLYLIIKKTVDYTNVISILHE